MSLRLSGTAYQALLPTPEEMASFDAQCIASGVPSLELMERAGKAMAKLIRERFPKGKVLIVCGPGNNGGDGAVVARLLKKAGRKVKTILVASSKYSEDLQVNVKRLKKGKTKPVVFPDEISAQEIKKILSASDLIVDALLGTGQKEAPRNSIAKLIQLIVASKKPVIALDIPSGVDAHRGRVFEPHISAILTITVELIKRGMLQYPAREACGDIVAVPIGIELAKQHSCCTLITLENSNLKARFKHAHKGTAGHVFVIGGSHAMPGAPVLSAWAALRAGSGLVTSISFQGTPRIIPELMWEPVGEALSTKHLELLKVRLKDSNCSILGPGLGTSAETIELVDRLLAFIEKEKIPVVLDADALNIVSLLKQRGKRFRLSTAVITPHPGEAARLLDKKITEVQEDRYHFAQELVSTYGAVSVLKGAGTIIAEGDNLWVNATGNPYMATAGSGDVLSGVIASLVGQGYELNHAARTGVFLHGLAGDYAHRKSGGPLIASDIIEALPVAFGKCICGSNY